MWWHSEAPQRLQDSAVGCELLQNGSQVVGRLYAALSLYVQRALRPLRENVLLQLAIRLGCAVAWFAVTSVACVSRCAHFRIKQQTADDRLISCSILEVPRERQVRCHQLVLQGLAKLLQCFRR